MQAMIAVLCLILPLLSTFVLFRGFRLWHDPVAERLARVVVYAILHLLPIQLLAALELVHFTRAVTLVRVAAFELLILAALLVYRLRHPPPRIETAAPATSISARVAALPASVRIGGGVIAACYAVFLLNMIASYPTGTDAISYHLPVAVRWLQEGSLRIPSSKEWHFSLPGNAELSMMVLLGTGWQALATLPQLLSALLIASASYSIARTLGACRSAAGAAILILLGVPIVTFQTFSGYIDLPGSAFFVAAVALFLCRYDYVDHAPNPRGLLLRFGVCGLACGVAVGTKPTFYVYVAAFMLAGLCILLLERDRHGIPVKTAAIVVVAAVLLPSVFWFGRATFATGNPVYPLKVEVAGHTIFDGNSLGTEMAPPDAELSWVRSNWEWPIYPWTEWKDSGFSYGTGTGLGASFATFIPLAFVVALWGLVRRQWSRWRPESIFAGATLGMGLIWWVALNRNPRFAIPLIAFGCALSAPLLGSLIRQRRTWFGALLVVSLATTSLISAFQPAHSLLARARIWTWTRAVYYGVPAAVDDFPSGSCVLNSANFMASFALTGKRLSNRVITFFERPAPLTAEFLDRHGVDYVVKMGARDKDDLMFAELGAKLIFEDSSVLLGGGEANPWRIWKVQDRAGAQRAAETPRGRCVEP